MISEPNPIQNATIYNISSECMNIRFEAPEIGSYDKFRLTMSGSGINTSNDNGIITFNDNIDEQGHICGLKGGNIYSATIVTVYKDQISSDNEIYKIVTGMN